MKNDYSFTEIISNAYSLILTKIFFKGARLIRRPFYCRGRSKLKFGVGFTTGRGCRFDLPSKNSKTESTLIFGSNCRIGDYVHIVALNKVVIGSNALLASKIFISDTDHGSYTDIDESSFPEIAPNERPLLSSSVIIGDNVWIGENVVILAGVEIGDGCIIGANSVVTKSIDKNSIVVGAPARPVKVFNDTINKWEKTNNI